MVQDSGRMFKKIRWLQEMTSGMASLGSSVRNYCSFWLSYIEKQLTISKRLDRKKT